MSDTKQGPWNLYVESQTTAFKETSFLCRATEKPCPNATDLGFCKLTCCTNREEENGRRS